MSDASRLAQLRLIRSPKVGPVTYRHLIQRFGSAEAAIIRSGSPGGCAIR